MLQLISERLSDYDANYFIDELFSSSKAFGSFEGKISSYRFSNILVPMLRIKEVVSSMEIEGTQTTITDVIEDKIATQKNFENKKMVEFNNHAKAIDFGTLYLCSNDFTDDLLKNLHRIMLSNITDKDNSKSIGKYKEKNNFIINSSGTIVFTPPPFTETARYMKDLLSFMNSSSDGINPLIKAAIIHSQFESIHPFEDGNGRVGRLLISLYLFKAGVINFPFFYISEAICQDRGVYYNMLTDSRNANYNRWIKYFLTKCTVQAEKLSKYIDLLNKLFVQTKKTVKDAINSKNFEEIINTIFIQPIITASFLAEKISVTPAQAKRYLDKLEEIHILQGDDRKRNKRYAFQELLELTRK